MIGRAGAFLVLALAASSVAAQQVGTPQAQPQAADGVQPLLGQVTTLEVPSPIVTIEADRLFAESAWGRRVQAELDRRGQALAAENRQIEEELEAEELALTRLRPEMEPSDFRARAAEFDEKVQRIRREQDAKEAELNAFAKAERQRFLQAVPESLRQVLKDSGAVAIVDKGVVLLAVAAIDITDKAIARVDADLGDGRSPDRAARLVRPARAC